MFFLWKKQKDIYWSNLDLRDEFEHNYTILCEISRKYIWRILSAVREIHSYKYIEFLTIPFKNNIDNKKLPSSYFDKVNGTSEELLKNLDIDKELIENYKYLNKLSKKWKKSENWHERMKDIISCMFIVHSSSYMDKLIEIAIKNKNFWLAEMISEQQSDENQIIKEIKDKYINRYNEIADSLYLWTNKWSIYNIETKLSLLQRELILIFWENSDIVTLCEKVIDDISFRWEEIYINSGKNTRWHFDGNSTEH